MIYDLKRSVDLRWFFDTVLHSSLDDLVRREGIGCPIKVCICSLLCFEVMLHCVLCVSVSCICENMCYTLYSEVLKMESTSNALIRSSLPLAHTGDILVTNVEMWPSAELMDGDNPFFRKNNFGLWGWWKYFLRSFYDEGTGDLWTFDYLEWGSVHKKEWCHFMIRDGPKYQPCCFLNIV